MTHLQDTEFVEFLDGVLSPERAAHVKTCERCRTELTAFQSAWTAVTADTPAEPSPLFWEHFARRVNERIDQVPAEEGASLWRPFLGGRFFAALGAAAALVVAVALGFDTTRTPEPVGPTTEIVGIVSSRPPAPAAVPFAEDVPHIGDMDDVDADAAWAVVRVAAEDLRYDEAHAEGIAPGPGSMERVAMELSTEERAELARLIETEMKRTGA